MGAKEMILEGKLDEVMRDVPYRDQVKIFLKLLLNHDSSQRPDFC